MVIMTLASAPRGLWHHDVAGFDFLPLVTIFVLVVLRSLVDSVSPLAELLHFILIRRVPLRTPVLYKNSTGPQLIPSSSASSDVTTYIQKIQFNSHSLCVFRLLSRRSTI